MYSRSPIYKMFHEGIYVATSLKRLVDAVLK